MIAVNELRIGNWLYSNPTLLHPNVTAQPSQVHVSSIEPRRIGAVQHNLEYRVEFFDDDLLSHAVPYFMPEELEAIPLTDEWLPKFGFKKANDKNGGWINDEKYGRQVRVSDDLTVNVGPFISIEIKSVHQLQNLYFAVTGGELDLKE